MNRPAIVTSRVALSVLCLGLLSACNNCEALESKICEDLGAADCKIWKDMGGPSHLNGGRRAGRFCFNARFNPTQYTPLITGAKAIVEAQKKLGAK